MDNVNHKNLRIFAANKLVRDATPQRLAARGVTVQSRTLTVSEYDQALREKLKEEADEVFHAASRQDLVDELADVLEVMHALCAAHNIGFDEVERVRQETKALRGGFEQRVYISQFELATDNECIDHYLNQPHKYPEIV